jgi:hypothetical protein
MGPVDRSVVLATGADFSFQDRLGGKIGEKIIHVKRKTSSPAITCIMRRIRSREPIVRLSDGPLLGRVEINFLQCVNLFFRLTFEGRITMLDKRLIRATWSSGSDEFLTSKFGSKV